MAINFADYVYPDSANGASFELQLDTEINTDGSGTYTKTAKPVKIRFLVQNLPLGPDSWEGDLRIVYDEDSWNEGELGSIYDDQGFEQGVKDLLMALGVPRDVADDIGSSEMGMQDDNLVSYDAPSLAQWIVEQYVIGDPATLAQRKTDVVRKLLEMVKDQSYDQASLFVAKLRKLRVTWPELDIIQQSLDAEGGGLDEEIDPEDYANFADDDFIHDKSTDEMIEIGRADPYKILTDLSNTTLPAEVWADAGVKHAMIKVILEMINSGFGSKHLKYWVELLREKGANYPELGVILGSLNAGNNLDESDNSDLHLRQVLEILKNIHSARDSDVESLFDSLSFELEDLDADSAIRIQDGLEQGKTRIVRFLLTKIRECLSDEVWTEDHELGYWGHECVLMLRHEYGISWPELDTIENSVKKQLEREGLDEAPRPKSTPDYSKIENAIRAITEHPSLILNIVYHAKHAGADLRPLWADAGAKTAVIKEWLEQIRQYTDDPYDEDYMLGAADSASDIESLKRMGCPWPELDVIHKGFEHHYAED